VNILITGGRSDMAKEMVKLYSALGHSCIVTVSTKENVKKIDDIYKDITPKVRTFCFALATPENSTKVLDELISSLGIDVLILNGWNKVDKLQLLHEVSEEDLSIELDVNIKGNLWLIRKVIPKMKDSNFGRILFISSIAAINGASRYGMYCLGKAAMEGLILNLAVDYGEFNIYSNILRPGIIKTERTKRFWEREFYSERMSRPIPAKKLGGPVHVAKATLPFIDEDSYTNGTALNVSGGLPLIRTKGSLK
jgi:3-oxoacyl-[acyl-carrier protein] reductase